LIRLFRTAAKLFAPLRCGSIAQKLIDAGGLQQSEFRR
jgi:hypothetical protein